MTDLPHDASPDAHLDREPGWRNTAVLRTAALVIAMYVAIRLLWAASPLVFTVFLGVLFGLALSSGVDRLQRFRIPRGVGAGLIAACFVGLLVGFGAWVAPTLRAQSIELRQRLPEAMDRIEAWANARRHGVVGTVLGLDRAARADSAAATPGTTPTATPAASGAVPATDTPAAADSAQKPTPLRDAVGQRLSGASRYLFPFVHSTIEVIAGVLLVLFLAIYIASDPATYHRGMMHLFPVRVRERAAAVLSAVAQVLRRWLLTQLIAMIAIGSAITIMLVVLHVRAAFALGVIAGLLEFIPTFGPILSSAPAIAMGFVDSPQKALYVAIAYVCVQFSENHLLIPLLMRGRLELPPAVTVVAQALMALIFGFLGLMVAVPLTAATMVTIRMLYVEGVVGEPVARSSEEEKGEARSARDPAAHPMPPGS